MILCLVKFVLINKNMPCRVIILQYVSYHELQQSTGSSCHVQSVLYLQNNNWRFMLLCRFFLDDHNNETWRGKQKDTTVCLFVLFRITNIED